MNNTEEHNENTDLMGNTNSIRSRKWVMTLNNYSEKEYLDLVYYFKHKKNCKFIIGKEVGATGTPHLQIYSHTKSAISFKTLKKFNERWHLEKARGGDKENYIYCSKENDYITNIEYDNNKKLINELYNGVQWREWQQNIIDMILDKPDNRKINFVVDYGGNMGKSFLVKYIYLKYGCIIADGKKDNVFNQVLNCEDEEYLKIILLDIPRHNLEYLNYGVIEQLKNGLIYSGKYEGGIRAFRTPHIFIFMNDTPDLTKLSKDRYNIINLNKIELDCN